MIADEELRAAAELALGADQGGPEAFVCPDCGKEYEGEHAAMKLRLHQRNAHGEGATQAAKSRERKPGAPAPGKRAPAGGAAVDAVVAEAVSNMIVLGGYVSIVLPHTGIAISGVPDPNDARRMIVASRAAMAGDSLAAWAKRDERVLEALKSFNGFLKASAAGEIVAGLGAAIAVDVGVIDPHMALEVGPFQGENAIRPVEAVIGDVIAHVDQLRAEYAQQAPPPPPTESPNGSTTRGARAKSAEVPGGVTGT